MVTSTSGKHGTFSLGGQFVGWLADWRSTPLALAVGGGACVALAVLLFARPGLLHGADSRLGEEARAAA